MLDEPEQLAVAAGLREGRREAWTRLYDAYSRDVWRYVARLLGPEAAAVADAVQETFMEAARRRVLRSGSAPSAMVAA